MTAGTKNKCGPWIDGVPDVERRCQLRCLAGLAATLCHDSATLVYWLRRAEDEPVASEEAWRLMEALPALDRRRVLATFARICWSSRSKTRGAA